jgi:hypothetical protein
VILASCFHLTSLKQENGFLLVSRGELPDETGLPIAERTEVSMANMAYGTVSLERQKEMSELEFVKGLASGRCP